MKRMRLVAVVCSVVSAFASLALAQLSDQDIQALKARAEAEGWSFEVGRNPATERTMDQLCGLKRPANWRDGARFDPCTPRRMALPSYFDWRDSGGVTPIRDQGACGSCWAFGTVGPLECNILIKDAVETDLSEQWLVSCNQDGWGCGGGWWAHDYHSGAATDPCAGTGAVMEADFPYAAADLSCGCPYDHYYLIDDWAYIGVTSGMGAVASTEAIKQAILDYGPVSSAIYVDSAFQAYTGGVFDTPGTGALNHAVVLVGWDDSQGTDGVWFLRNSWGTGWGEAGYMRIEYGNHLVGDSACYVDYAGAVEGPDLRVTSIAGPGVVCPECLFGGGVGVGGTYQVAVTVRNMGTVASGACTVAVFLSEDGDYDEMDDWFVGSAEVPALDPAGSWSGSVEVNLCMAGLGVLWPVTDGYWLGYADYYDVVEEGNELNNTRASNAVHVGPPTTPHDPGPADTETGVRLDTMLSWSSSPVIEKRRAGCPCSKKAAGRAAAVRPAGERPTGVSIGLVPAGLRRAAGSAPAAVSGVRPLGVTDSGFGPDPVWDTTWECVLNAPESLIAHGSTGGYIHWPGADFGNDGDFSFLYVLDDDDNRLCTLGVETGTVTEIGSCVPYGSESWTGLGMDPTAGTMYASSTDISVSSLYTVDLSTGAATRIGEITNAPGIIDIAVDNSGQIYGLDIYYDNLVSIDKATGAGTVIGSLGFDANYSQGMDFDESTNTLYLSAYNGYDYRAELRIADTSTGATTLVGVLGSSVPGEEAELTDFAIATGGCATTYDVYFGTDPEVLTLICENVTEPVCDPTPGEGELLEPGTTYYWRVYALNCCNDVNSPLWQFTTGQCLPPGVPRDPDPAHEATDVPLDTMLSWQSGGGPYDVLILTADYEPTVFKAGLEACEDIASVDYFDARGDVPTLEELAPYDAVIVASDYAFADEVATGDVLADYVDGGGKVIQAPATFAFDEEAGWELHGRFVAEGYEALVHGPGPMGPVALWDYVPDHPIMDGVTALSCTIVVDTDLQPGAVWVADWDNDEPLVATQGRSVVGINVHVYDTDGLGAWAGDVPLLFRNAVVWLNGVVPAATVSELPAHAGAVVTGPQNALTPRAAQPRGRIWSPAGASPLSWPSILIYCDDFYHVAPNTYVDQALQELALAYTAYYDDDFAGFETALAGGSWDLVIFANDNYGAPESSFDALEAYLDGGGKLVVHSCYMYAYPDHTLWAKMGGEWVADDGDPPDPVYWWDPGHALFNDPESVPEFTDLAAGRLGTCGQYLNVVGDGTAVAGYTAPGMGNTASAALIVAQGGSAILRGFLDGQNDADLDEDEKPDGMELWVNIINYMVGPTSCDVRYDVYFGTDPEALELIASNLTEPTCDPTPEEGAALDQMTTYYWQVVASNGAAEVEGPVWEFTTVCVPPEMPSNPDPADEATDVPLDTDLSWSNPFGWYSEDFEDGLAQDWVPVPPELWEVVSGEYRADGTGYDGWLQSSYQEQAWDDCAVQVTTRRTGTEGYIYNASVLAVRATADFSLLGTAGSGYFIGVNTNGWYYVAKLVGGSLGWLQDWSTSPYLNTGEDPNVVQVSLAGTSIEVYFNGSLAWSGSDGDVTDAGGIALWGYTETNTVYYFDDVSVQPPLTAPMRVSAEQQWYNAHPVRGGSLAKAPAGANVPVYPGSQVTGIQNAVTARAAEPVGRIWSPRGASRLNGPSILIYCDDLYHYAPDTYVDQALQELGLAYTAYYDEDFAGFEAALAGGSWDLVILANDNYGAPESTFDALESYLDGGGKLVVHSWVMDDYSYHPLWAKMGGEWMGNDTDVPDPVYWWEPGHALFNDPESVPEFTDLEDVGYGVYGVYLNVVGDGTAVAGYSGISMGNGDDAALIIAQGGSAILRGFMDGQNDADLDTDGKPDGMELWLNIISYLLGGTCPTRYDVYFGTDPEAMELIAEDLSELVCDPTPEVGQLLDRTTTYFWKVVAKDCCAETEGPVWSFTTECPLPETPANPDPADEATDVPLDTVLSWSTSWISEDFEAGLGGFTIDNEYGDGDGLWHRSEGRGSDSGHSPTHSLYFGDGEGPDGGGDYDVGTTEGVVLSPVIDLSGATPPIALSFNYFLETEDSSIYDTAAVELSQDGGAFQVIASNNAGGELLDDPSGGWVPASVDLSAYAGSSIQLRFYFATFDDEGNDFEGWYVDDVVVSGGAGLPMSAVLWDRGPVPPSGVPVSVGPVPPELRRGTRNAAAAGSGVRPLFPTDSAFGCEWEGQIYECALNAPETLIAHGSDTSDAWVGTEFGNTGDFSFLYAIGYLTNKFVTLDIETGALTEIGTPTPYGGEIWTGLAMDSTTGTMYACSTDISNSSLYTIDLSTGAATRVGEVTNCPAIIDIAVDTSGQTYGLDLVNDNLVSIDKATGAGTVVGSVGFDANYSQGMDFDESTNTLYLAAYNNSTSNGELRIADTSTGATTLVGVLGETVPGYVVQINDLAVATVAGCQTTYDVYFGTDPGALELIAEDLTEPTCDPTPVEGEFLARGETYFWKVVAKNCCGETEGPVWSFTTSFVPREHGQTYVNSDWRTVGLTEPFTDPIVVAGPVTSCGWQPCVVRLRNITPTSFQIKVQEWPCQDGPHVREVVHWLAVERGEYDLPGGGHLIAGSVNTNKTNVFAPSWLAFPGGGFLTAAEAPVAIAQIQTYNGAETIVSRIVGVYPGGMHYAMQEQEASDQVHCYEKLGYVAVSPDATNLLDIPCEVGKTPVAVTHKFYTVPTSFGTCAVRVYEDYSADAELVHAAERVGYIAVGGLPPILADMQTCFGADPCNLRCKMVAVDWQSGSGVSTLGKTGEGLLGILGLRAKPAPELCTLLVSAQEEGGAQVGDAAVEVASSEDDGVALEALPLRRACERGEVVTLTAPASLAGESGMFAFSHWEVDGEPSADGLLTVDVEMTGDREAVALYVSAE